MADFPDWFDDLATALGSLVTAADELADDPPPSLNRQTIQDLQRALAEATRVLKQLEEQLESGKS